MSYEAMSFDDVKAKVNLNYARKITAPPEYENFYAGVCDVIEPKVALALAADLREYRKNPDRKIMIGVMTHPIMLDPESFPEEVFREVSREFPLREQMAAAFTDDPDVLNTLHYADLYGPEGRQWEAGASPNVLENLELCVEYGGENLHAIQLDVTWPEPSAIKAFKEKYPDILIILQVGKFAMDAVANDPQKMVDLLREYDGSVDFVLLDMSMGKGKSIGTGSDVLLRQLNLIQYELPGLGLAIAGGFGPGSMDSLKPIADEFPDIAIDAQGRLKADHAPRDGKGHFIGTVQADLDRASEYIRQSCDLLDN